jgi:hypothetical protein
MGLAELLLDLERVLGGVVALEGIVIVHFAYIWVCDEGLCGLERIGMIVSDWLP